MSLHVGDTVKDCDRVGYSLEYDKTVRGELTAGDYNKQIVEQQQALISIKDLTIKTQQDQVTLWQTDDQRERQHADQLQQRGDTKFWIGLGAGIALTVLSAWAVGQAAKH